MKIRHILILSDLSPESLRPVAPIADLARAHESRVTLLTVVKDVRIAPHGAPLAPKVSSPEADREAEHAQLALTDQAATLEGLTVQTEVLRSDAVPDAVTKYAAEHEVDLIALSTHGRTGFRHFALGSVAESVLRHSTVPVITFPRTDA